MNRRLRNHLFQILIAILTLIVIYKYTFGSSNTADSKTLVIYIYYEKNELHKQALEYFLDIGVSEADNVDYLFVIQGKVATVKIPSYKNIVLFEKDNDCYDFGSLKFAINYHGGIDSLVKYKSIIVINSSVFGPFLPNYWPENIHWTEIFNSRLRDDVHLVGTILACTPDDDPGGQGPRISGMFFAITPTGISLANDKKAFECYKTKHEVILNGEYALTKAILEAGYNLDTILLQYGRVDWRDKKNWNCNDKKFPFRKNQYGKYNIDINPLETVFFKPIWLVNNEIVTVANLNETYQYMEWARERAKSKN